MVGGAGELVEASIGGCESSGVCCCEDGEGELSSEGSESVKLIVSGIPCNKNEQDFLK